jgi:succinylarginine dihydrolase
MSADEVNFDGLVGPTHNFGGLSYGNQASLSSSKSISHPKKAAKQGLIKMKALYDLGLKQAVLPPHERPDLSVLRQLGFSGSDRSIVQEAARKTPMVFRNCCSSAAMWTANTATVSPSADTKDGKVHLTPANLTNKFHRSFEHQTTQRVLEAIFNDPQYFSLHQALPSSAYFGDEGAANHTRFCDSYGRQGVEFFVFGKFAFDRTRTKPKKYPARQSFEASEAIARLHGLPDSHVVYAQQNPDVIDLGVFHNDVISVGNQQVLFCHEKAFLHQKKVYQEIQEKADFEPLIIEVPEKNVTVSEAIDSYLFNSQLVSTKQGEMILIAPEEARKTERVKMYLEELVTLANPISAVQFFDLKQSMKNGGGPACLRLRVVLTKPELRAVNQKVLFSPQLFETLNNWVDQHYRDDLAEEELADPKLMLECQTALDQLTQILDLGSLYPFQR